jgi:precorrin-2/cobalt-factor-2 C20-methyltransferase
VNKLGKLIGVSVGPGDPGLITRRGWELLNQPEMVWTYPVRNEKSDSFALGIVLRSGLELPAEHTPLIFPMTHDLEKLAKAWIRAAQQVFELLTQGKDVIFLVEGDASTYSTFGHLAKSLKGLDKNVEVEVVAGVTSFSAAAAVVGNPIVEVDDTLAILPAGYGVDTVENLLNDFDSLVLMKVKPLMDDLLDMLERKGVLADSVFVERVGAPDERVVRDLLSLRGEKVNYLSLLLVKNPNRVKGEIQRGCRKK